MSGKRPDMIVPRAKVGVCPRIAVRRNELSEMLGVSVRTLDDLLAKGEGPPHFRFGGGRIVLFPVKSAEEWAIDQARAAEPDGDGQGDGEE